MQTRGRRMLESLGRDDAGLGRKGQSHDPRLMWGTFAAVAILRGFLFFANWYGIRILQRVPNYNPGIQDSFNPDHAFLEGWSRWDSAHYLPIAIHGYGPPGAPNEGAGTAFFPAYPLLIRGLAQITGLDSGPGAYAGAAILLSNLCFFAAIVLFFLIVAEGYGAAIASTATLLLAASPFSFFFSAAYTESLFLLCAVGALYFAGKDRWLLASICVAVAGSVRLLGLALIPALVLLALQRRAAPKSLLALVGISPLGTVAWFGWLWWRYDDVLLYFHQQANWGPWSLRVGDYAKRLITDPFGMATDTHGMIILVNLTVALAFLATVPRMWKQTRVDIACFSTIMILFHLVYTWNSLARYLLPAVGSYIVVAILLEKMSSNLTRSLLFSLSAGLLTLLTVLFGLGFWIV